MSAMPPDSFLPIAPAPLAVGLGAAKTPDGGPLAARWLAVLDAGALVGALAGHAVEPVGGALRSFPAAMVQAGGQRLVVASQGVEDLSVILETGLRVLLTVHASGASARPAAEALHGEFRAARDALLALRPPARRAMA